MIRGRVSIAHDEMIDPRVQAVGDMAVLTFNHVADGTDAVTTRWHCTEVYRRDADTWRIIQRHWSFTQRAEQEGPPNADGAVPGRT
jgi:hypothetical protein